MLRRIEAPVGQLDTRIGDAARLARHRDTRAEPQPVAGGEIELLQRRLATDPFDDVERILQPGRGQDDEEFLPTPAPDDVGRTDASLDHPGELAQHLVARVVTEGVVARFEMVDVEQRERGTRVRGIRSGQGRAYPLQRRAAIGESRQRVGHRKAAEAAAVPQEEEDQRAEQEQRGGRARDHRDREPQARAARPLFLGEEILQLAGLKARLKGSRSTLHVGVVEGFGSLVRLAHLFVSLRVASKREKSLRPGLQRHDPVVGSVLLLALSDHGIEDRKSPPRIAALDKQFRHQRGGRQGHRLVRFAQALIGTLAFGRRIGDLAPFGRSLTHAEQRVIDSILVAVAAGLLCRLPEIGNGIGPFPVLELGISAHEQLVRGKVAHPQLQLDGERFGVQLFRIVEIVTVGDQIGECRSRLRARGRGLVVGAVEIGLRGEREGFARFFLKAVVEGQIDRAAGFGAAPIRQRAIAAQERGHRAPFCGLVRQIVIGVHLQQDIGRCPL